MDLNVQGNYTTNVTYNILIQQINYIDGAREMIIQIGELKRAVERDLLSLDFQYSSIGTFAEVRIRYFCRSQSYFMYMYEHTSCISLAS